MLTLKKGDKAPAFSAKDQQGNPVNLEDYKGNKLILYFYPKDDTPGCTAEACNLKDNETALQEKGFRILGVSADTAAKHQKFIDKYGLPFPLIPDTEKEIINAYGVWGPKKFMGREYEGIHRVTFIIDENGFIENIFTKVKTKEHSEQILEAYK
jgi:peroxiredoxin Q/BCP